MRIPAPDAYRCTSVDDGDRCMLAAGHEATERPERHCVEKPVGGIYHATVVRYWGPHQPSDLPEGPYVEVETGG